MSFAQARMTTGSILSTVSTAAGAITSVLDTGVSGINMLDNYVKNRVEDQRLRAIADRKDFIFRLAEEKSAEISERQLSIDAFCNKSARHAELYNSNYTDLLALLTASK